MELLSEEECERLLGAVRDVAAGDRFWEGDSGLFYNEYVKLRYFRVGRNAPTAPAIGHDSFVPTSPTKSYPGSERVTLPAARTVDAQVQPTLRSRRSRRDYTGEPVGLDVLSALLEGACGISATVPAYGFDHLPLRTFPTHGGLQSPEVYLWARAVHDLPSGIYHYEPRSHSVELLRNGNFDERMHAIAFGEDYVRQASVVLLVTGVHDRLRWKYGERAYRFICMDVGFVGENVYLVSEALGLGACAISGFAQDAAEALLDVDGRHEPALLLLTVGAVPPTAAE